MIARLHGLSHVQAPRGALALLCASILALPAGFAIAHQAKVDSQGRWIHHHTTEYTTCNNIDQNADLGTQASNARNNWGWNDGNPISVLRLPTQSDCHPASGEEAHIQLIDGNYGNTGWRASSVDDSNPAANAAYHARHTHIAFNLSASWSNYTNYDRRALACKEIGQVLGVERVFEAARASHGQDNDCMSFGGAPNDQTSKDENANNYTYIDRPGSHSGSVVNQAYGPVPDTEITSQAPLFVDGSPIAVTFTSPSGSAFECRTDAGSWAGCSSPYQTSTLNGGTHSVSIRALSEHGVVDPTPATVQFTVDTSAPAVTLEGELVNGVNPQIGSDTELEISATDAGSGVTGATLLVDGQQIDEIEMSCPSGGCPLDDVFLPDFSGLSGGSHDFSILVEDAVGNSRQLPSPPATTPFRVDPNPPEQLLTGALVDADGEPLPGATGDLTALATETASGDVGVEAIEILIDDDVVATETANCSSSCPSELEASYTYEKAEWGEGPHSVTITSIDAAGNLFEDELEVDAPGPSEPASCPETTPVSQDPEHTLSVAAAEAAALPEALAPSDSTTDSQSGTLVDPSLSRPDDSPPTPLDAEGSLVDGEVPSVPAGEVEVDRFACLVPAQTTASETAATVVNNDVALYANTASDTDTVVRPTATGQAIILSLRGSEAPSSFSWQVGVQEGDILEPLADGGVAIVDPDVSGPGEASVPEEPPSVGDPDGIADAEAQLAEETYQVISAEQELDLAVNAVIPAPYAVLADGSSSPLELSVDGAAITVSNVPSAAEAVALHVQINLARNAAPRFVRGYYILALSREDLQTKTSSAVCNYYERKSPSQKRLLILDMGAAVKLPSGEFGASVHNPDQDLANTKIYKGLRAAANTAASGLCDLGKVSIAYGINNTTRIQNPGIASDAGKAQAAVSQRLRRWQRRNAFVTGGEQSASVAGDIETGWGPPDIGKALASGATRAGGGRWFNYGTAGGCPPVDECKNGWSQNDLAQISYGRGARTLPQIYCRTPDNAAQWNRIAREGPSSFGFAGTTAQGGDAISPETGWRRLRRASAARVGREIVRFPDPGREACG